VRHHFRVCKPWLEEQKQKLVDNTVDEYTPEIAVRTPSQLTTASSQNSASVVVVEPKVQSILVGSKNGALNYVSPGINFSHLQGLLDDWVAVCEIPFEAVEADEFMGIISYLCPQYKQVDRKTVRDDIVKI